MKSEDTEFLTKCAQHLAELHSTNAFEFIYLLNPSEGSGNYPILGSTAILFRFQRSKLGFKTKVGERHGARIFSS